MLNRHPSFRDSFENCGDFARTASVKPDHKDIPSSPASIFASGAAGTSDSPRAVTVSTATLIPARSNNTTPTLHAFVVGSVRKKKHNRYEKRNVNQLVAVRRMPDCNR